MGIIHRAEPASTLISPRGGVIGPTIRLPSAAVAVAVRRRATSVVVRVATCGRPAAGCRLRRRTRSSRLSRTAPADDRPAANRRSRLLAASRGRSRDAVAGVGCRADPPLHLPSADRRGSGQRTRLRRGLPLPGPGNPAPARRPGGGDAHLQRLHGIAPLPGRRGLTDRTCERARRGRQRGGLYAGFCTAPEGTATVIHLGPPVARRLMRPTRGTAAARRCPGEPGHALLLGLAPGRACRVSPRRRLPGGGLVSVALVLASRRTGVTRYPAPGSPDVPHAGGFPPTRDRPAASLAHEVYPARSERAAAGSAPHEGGSPVLTIVGGSVLTAPRARARPRPPRHRREGAP
jgi:hypothetical protein